VTATVVATGVQAATSPDDERSCSSYEQAYSRLVPFAYNVGYRFRGGDRAFAEDVAQEAMTRAYVAWPRLRHHPNVEAWITVTAFRVALEVHRKQRRATRPTSLLPLQDGTEDEQRLADSDQLAHALRHLSSRQQQVLVWRFYFDQSVQQTAERMGLTESKVKDATHQALTKLGRIMRTGDEVRSRDVDRSRIRRPTQRYSVEPA
jgi:RNA polymerase sigma factor (sigma-70 family)